MPSGSLQPRPGQLGGRRAMHFRRAPGTACSCPDPCACERRSPAGPRQPAAPSVPVWLGAQPVAPLQNPPVAPTGLPVSGRSTPTSPRPPGLGVQPPPCLAPAPAPGLPLRFSFLPGKRDWLPGSPLWTPPRAPTGVGGVSHCSRMLCQASRESPPSQKRGDMMDICHRHQGQKPGREGSRVTRSPGQHPEQRPADVGRALKSHPRSGAQRRPSGRPGWSARPVCGGAGTQHAERQSTARGPALTHLRRVGPVSPPPPPRAQEGHSLREGPSHTFGGKGPETVGGAVGGRAPRTPERAAPGPRPSLPPFRGQAPRPTPR